MADIQITTDGTIAGTKLVVDSKDITKKEKVVYINMVASAGFVSKYSGDPIPGYASVTYEVSGDDGKIERKSYGTSETAFTGGVGPKKMKDEDSVSHFIGQELDTTMVDLIDKIEKTSKEKGVFCPPRETLVTRSMVSLRDKAQDLGIELEDTETGNED